MPNFIAGEATVYKSVDNGSVALLDSRTTASQLLHLKIGCPVILIHNISDKLVNGMRGEVIDFGKNGPVVRFGAANITTVVEPVVFEVYSNTVNKVIGSRRQVPLKLAYSFTVHKSQGMTFDQVEVDCRKMTFPGQVAVAVSRATCKMGLRVWNFNRSLIPKPAGPLVKFNSRQSSGFEQTLDCCHNGSTMDDVTDLPHEHTDIQDPETDLFENEDGIDEQLVQVLEELESRDNELHENTELTEGGSAKPVMSDMLPEDFELVDELNKLKYCIDNDVPQQRAANILVDNMLSNLERTNTMVTEIARNIYAAYKECISKAGEAKNKDVTTLYSKVLAYIQSDKYRQSIEQLFSVTSLSSTHCNTAFRLVVAIREAVMRKAASGIMHIAKETAEGDVRSYKNTAAGLGKIRYIAGWCVVKIKI